MKMKVQLVIEDESGGTTTTDLVDIERGAEGLIGLSLAEAKALNARVQRALIDAQAREAIARGAVCSECKEGLRRNGTHRTLYRTAFGRIELRSPRFYTCRCQGTQRSSRSPLSAWLGSHISPELEYLEGQFAALLPYGVSARILNTVLPLDNATSITSWRRRIGRIGERLDREAHEALPVEPQLNEFGLPKRHPLQAIGIDGAYVKATDAPSRQEGWFEVIVGKSLPREGIGKCLCLRASGSSRSRPSGWRIFSSNKASIRPNRPHSSLTVVKLYESRKGISDTSVNLFSTGFISPCG